MIITKEICILFLAVLLICLIGFKKYVWFISIGYGFSITVIGAICLALFLPQLDIIEILACIVLILYGIRLGGFLAYRELNSKTYNKKMKGEISDGSHMSIPLKMLLWLSCGLLYIMMTSPLLFRFVNNLKSDNLLIVGIVITILGIALEAESDAQKNQQKRENPNRFCDKGLFELVRCPNYLGELIIWTGVFVGGISALNSIGQWIVAIIGYAGIVYIMFSGARRLEIRQDKNYGEDKEYKKYVKKTPILIPFIPLYSVKKHKWLVG